MSFAQKLVTFYLLNSSNYNVFFSLYYNIVAKVFGRQNYQSTLMLFTTFLYQIARTKIFSFSFFLFQKVPKPKYVVAVLYSPDNELVVGDSNGNVLLFNEGSNKVNKSECNVHKVCIPTLKSSPVEN